MTTLKLVTAVAMLALALATPAIAQQVIPQPGLYAPNPGANDPNNGFGPPGFQPGYVGRDSYAYYGRPATDTDNDAYAPYYGDRPVTRRTTCGLQSGANYLGPDGRWYPC